jgi:hypothetical protein
MCVTELSTSASHYQFGCDTNLKWEICALIELPEITV